MAETNRQFLRSRSGVKLESRSMVGYTNGLCAVLVPERTSWRVGSMEKRRKKGCWRIGEKDWVRISRLVTMFSQEVFIHHHIVDFDEKFRIGLLTDDDPCLAGPRGW